MSAEKTIYGVSILDKGLLIPTIARAIWPLGGNMTGDITVGEEIIGGTEYPTLSVKLVFNPTKLHEYIAQSLLPDLGNAPGGK
jgi:hypothetical protein